jgi:hypothetical protein
MVKEVRRMKMGSDSLILEFEALQHEFPVDPRRYDPRAGSRTLLERLLFLSRSAW